MALNGSGTKVKQKMSESTLLYFLKRLKCSDKIHWLGYSGNGKFLKFLSSNYLDLSLLRRQRFYRK